MKKDVYRLTNPQKNIWELEQINGEATPINHIMSIMKLKGNLEEELLEKAMNKIIEENDSFRLKFIKNGQELCQYVEEYQHVPIDIKHYGTEDITEAIEEYQKMPLSLNKLFAICLVFTPSYTYVLYKTHHIISDAWSCTQFADQIKDFYEKLSKNEPEEAFKKPSYLNFIDRENAYFETSKCKQDEEFWKNYIQTISTTKLFKGLDIDKKEGKRYSQPISNTLFNSIHNYCEKNKITEYAFFLAIFSIYFSKIYNLNNIIFGTTFLNRQKRFHEFECTGMFVSTLPLTVKVEKNDNFLSLCQTISATNLSLFRHSAYPYHNIQELYCEETRENTSLYEIGFSYQINKQENSMENNDSGDCSWLYSGYQNNPLSIHLTTLNNEKLLNYDYLTDCFSEFDIQKMNSIIFHLISEVLEGKNEINDIDVLTDEDLELLIQFNSTRQCRKYK